MKKVKLPIGTVINRKCYASGVSYNCKEIVGVLPIGKTHSEAISSYLIGENAEVCKIASNSLTLRVEYAAGGWKKPYYVGHNKLVIKKSINEYLFNQILNQI